MSNGSDLIEASGGRDEETDEETAEDREMAAETELRARLEVLEAENRRLRRDYASARRSQYRRTAIGMAAIGLVAVLGGFLFPPNRDVLFALGGTGLFAALLTYYLTPEQVIPASVGERVYHALADTEGRLVSELGLQEERVYIPTDDPDLGVRLFVPQHATYELPALADLADVLVVPDEESQRGVAFGPSGGALFEEFQTSLAGDLAESPGPLLEQLRDGIVEQFELARSLKVDVDEENGTLTVGVAGSAYGDIDRFDHPIPSFIGVGLARGLGTPVRVTVTEAEDDRVDHLITCSWDVEGDLDV